MHKKINNVRTLPGYKLENKHINVICRADDAVLIAQSEGNLQWILHKFLTVTKT